MRLILQIFSIFILLQFVSAQYFTNWTNYQFIDPGNDLTRDAAYNPATDNVLVATRYTGTNIFVLSAEKGDSLTKMDTQGINEGTYPINQIEVGDDGYIYVCNLAVAGAKFKIYRYEEEFLAPELIYENVFDERYGDSFSVVGTGDNTYFYSSGFNNDKLLVLHGTADGDVEFDYKIDLPSINSARTAISPVSPGGKIWINGAGTSNPPARLINFDGTVIAQVPDSLLSSIQGSFIKYFSMGGQNYLAGANAAANTVRVFKYTEDNLGTVTFQSLGPATDAQLLAYDSSTVNNNINATTSIDYDSTRNSLITLMGVNSVASVNLSNVTAIENSIQNVVRDFSLGANYPNPFNPTTQISYSLKKAAHVSVNVYDTSGKRITTLVNKRRNAGVYNVKFDATGLSSAVYLYSLFVNGQPVQSRKMVLLK